ncbi:MAG: TetR-like C-terminal domain-containing protein [Oscillospiraceae bacterium]
MNSDKLDRRVKYTNYRLRESLIRLMQTQSVTKISVKMLCEDADINRSTFYAHYADTYDLLKSLEQEVIGELKTYINEHTQVGQTEMTIHVMSQLLAYTKENAALFKVLLSENSNVEFRKDVMAIAQEKILSEVRCNPHIDARTAGYLQCFIITGALEILQIWLWDGTPESIPHMAQLVTNLLFGGISRYFEKLS